MSRGSYPEYGAVASGTNALVLGLTYPHGATPTVTDNNGNTWPGSPAVSADRGVGNYVAAIFVLPGVRSGQTLITVTFGSNQTPFNYALSEFSNIAPSSPVDVALGATGVTGPTLASGSITTTQAGDLIWSYFPICQTAGGNPSNFTGGSGFTILDADIAWINNQGFPHASQWQVQSAAGAINPGMTATAGTGSANVYNCVSVALKTVGTPKLIQHVASSADPAGIGGPAGDSYKIPIPNPCGNTNPTGLHINRINHFTMGGTIGAGTWKLQFPVVGNYVLLPFQIGSANIPISGITDSEGNTWSQVAGGASTNFPQYWAASRTAGSNPNLIISVAVTSNAGAFSPSIRATDLSGVNATPIDATATASVGAAGVSSVSNQPSITVPTAGDLVIATMAIGQGPGLAVTSPTGAVWDLILFTGETDMNLIENADAHAHLYNASATTLNWNWNITNQVSNSVNSTAIAIKSV